MVSNNTRRKQVISFLSIVIILIVLVAGTIVVLQNGQKQQSVSTRAQSYPTGFQEIKVASGLTQPTAMEFAPDGRLFVAEKGGKLRVVKNNTLLPQPFLTVPVKTDGERGLLGITVDPDFASNKFLYVYYTDDSRSVNRVIRYTADSANPDVAAAGSETVVLDNIPSSAGYHNGGAIHFGTDGKLYIAIGESHTSSNAQSMTTIAGKILRINKDGTIPTDNPFYQTASGINQSIWALGFRNPFTFAVNPSSGKIFVNDVGASTWEEVNDLQKGGNYGWPTCEGTCDRGFINPIHAYKHDVGKAITGGAFYTGTSYPSEYQGSYFFSDYTANWIKQLNPSDNKVTTFVTGLKNPVDIRMGAEGQLYYLSYHGGLIYRIQYGNGANPSAPANPTQGQGGNNNPTISITIVKPTAGTLYSAGDTIEYEGIATDMIEDALPESAFSWKIETVHNDEHTHPFLDAVMGKKSGSFLTGKVGETDANIKYRIYLSVKNSKGQSNEVTQDVLPNNATMEFTSNPAGLELTIDGQPKKTPFTITGVVGFQREIGAPTTQTFNSKNYLFVSWSDTGKASHTVFTPKSNTTYTAEYSETSVAPPDKCLGACPTTGLPISAPGGPSTVPSGTNNQLTIVPTSNQSPQLSPAISPTEPGATGDKKTKAPGGGQSKDGLIKQILNLILKILELLMSLLK